METGDIIVIDRVEDDSYNSKDFKKVTDKAGNTFNVKQGQGGKLKDKWHLLEEGTAIKLTVGTYNNKPFVKDFEVVKDEFLKQAAEKAQVGVKTERNDSIEAQVAFKGMIELIATGMVKTGTKEYKATIEWAMTRLHSVEQIMAKIEEAKSETHKDAPGSQETQTELTPGQDSGEATDVKTVGQLFNWIMFQDKSIKAPRLWVNTEFGLDDKVVLTDKKVAELYKAIKEKMGW